MIASTLRGQLLTEKRLPEAEALARSQDPPQDAGVIDARRYGIIDNSIQLQRAPISSTGIAQVTAVPEPASTFTAAALLAMSLAPSRRRRPSRRCAPAYY